MLKTAPVLPADHYVGLLTGAQGGDPAGRRAEGPDRPGGHGRRGGCGQGKSTQRVSQRGSLTHPEHHPGSARQAASSVARTTGGALWGNALKHRVKVEIIGDKEAESVPNPVLRLRNRA